MGLPSIARKSAIGGEGYRAMLVVTEVEGSDVVCDGSGVRRGNIGSSFGRK